MRLGKNADFRWISAVRLEARTQPMQLFLVDSCPASQRIPPILLNGLKPGGQQANTGFPCPR
ncbi:MAG TPA: hypothetical protein VJ770_14175 [Stellaceae bacterium]|nr:hypothetical protein [Stellaceae bacterium]